MTRKMDIKVNYSPKPYTFSSRPKSIYMPYVNAIIKNLQTGDIDKNTNEFLVDTGASVSIINKRYESFLSKIKPHDGISLQYVNGHIKKCPLYRIGIIIKGQEFELSAAYDDDCPFLLLGHFEFLERNTYTIFDSSSNRLQIIRR
jgi:predicted aspartyl protease